MAGALRRGDATSPHADGDAGSTEPLLLEVYFASDGLRPRGVARELRDGPYPLREGLPLRLWEMDPLEDGTPDYMVEDAVAEYVLSGQNAWTLVPDRISDAALAALDQSGELDGVIRPMS